ncbi:MAG: hypothetical protein ACLGH8_00845 [Bacteroidia bacterium]
MENTRLMPKDTAAKLYTQTKQSYRSNPLFEESHRSMSGGDYINLHQRQYNMGNTGSGRFSWLMPDED